MVLKGFQEEMKVFFVIFPLGCGLSLHD